MDIEAMARKHGDAIADARGRVTFSFDCYGLEEFAAAVKAAERDACTKACAALEVHDIGHPGTAFKVQEMCINAINERSNEPSSPAGAASCASPRGATC